MPDYRVPRLLALLTAVVLLPGTGCVPGSGPERAEGGAVTVVTMSEKVNFNTDDGVTIAADYYEGEPGGPSGLLLHMMPATKESWQGFAKALLDAGYSRVLAIDLRGHGESVQKGNERLDYKQFEDADHQAKIRDVEAAVKWLEDRGAEKGRLAVVGASIGANLAIVYGAEHNEVPAVVALSPGLDYRGVTTPDKVERYSPEQGLYLAASEEDELSFMTDRRLAEIKNDAVVKEFKDAGHGTRMLDTEPALAGEIISWLKERVH